MTELNFIKISAAGQHYICYKDIQDSTPLSAMQIAKLCDYSRGVGAQAVIRAVQSKNTAEGRELLDKYPEAEWFLDVYNAAGNTSLECGNAVRAYVLYLVTKGFLSPADRRETVAIATRTGVKDALLGIAGSSVDFGRWRFQSAIANAERAKKPVEKTSLNATSFTTYVTALPQMLNETHLKFLPGVTAAAVIKVVTAQLVVHLQSAAALAALKLETVLEFIKNAALEVTTVVFVSFSESAVKNSVGQLQVRVFERAYNLPTDNDLIAHKISEPKAVNELGSHGEAAAAAALLARYLGGKKMPHHWRVASAAGALGVRMFPTESGEHVSISGGAEVLFEGKISLG